MLERHGQVPPRASFGGATPMLPGTPARSGGNNKVPGSAYSTPVGGGAGGPKTPFGLGPAQMAHLTPAQRSAIATSQKKGQPIPPSLMLAINAAAAGGNNQKQSGTLGGKKMFPAPPALPHMGAPPLPGSGNFDSLTGEFPGRPSCQSAKPADLLPFCSLRLLYRRMLLSSFFFPHKMSANR